MGQHTDYSKKGAYFLGFIAFVLIFISLLIWVYTKNTEFLPIQ